MRYIPNAMGIAEKQALEIATFEHEQQAAKIDYIAMMTDVDISDLEPEVDDDEPEV